MAIRAQRLGTTEPATEAETRDLPLVDAPIIKMMGWPIEVWLRCQAGLLKAAEPVATGWIERRREATATALETFEKLAGCTDLNEAASIQRAWFEATIKRLDSDLHALADQAMAVSQETMAATRYAAQTSSEVVSFAIQPVQWHEQESAEAAA